MGKRKITIQEIMDGIHSETPDGAMTFGGFVREHFNGICRLHYWRAENTTKRVHLLEVVNTIIPAIEDHDLTPIYLYDEVRIRQIVHNIETIGRVRGGVRIPHEPGRMHDFERLIRQILEYAEKINVCTPIESSRAVKCQKNTSQKQLEKTVVRRHMEPLEEAKFLIEVIPALIDHGEARLALVIYATGIRPSEACGLNWDALQLKPETNICKLTLAQSVRPGYNKPQLTMKTRNGHRVMIVNRLVYDLLMAAKAVLRERWIVAGNDPTEFDHLPLGTKSAGSSTSKRCANYDIAHYINPIFEKIGIRSRELTALREEMLMEYQEYVACGEDADYDDYAEPSTYLLRHVYATANVPLGLSVAMRQYYQGHKIDDPAVDRRTMATNAVQRVVQNLREEHPLLGLMEQQEYELEEGLPLTARGCAETIIVPPGVTEINVYAEEPGDTITMCIRGRDAREMVGTISYTMAWRNAPSGGYKEPVNALRFYHQEYAAARQKLLEAFPDLYDGVAPWHEQQ